MGKDPSSLDELTDEELMTSYRLGEAEAFDLLYRRYSSKVYGFIVKRVGRGSAADDIFQEVFLRLHRFRGRYNASLPFLPWLFTITRNTLVDHERKRIGQERREAEIQGELEHHDTEESECEELPNVEEVLRHLTPREREVLTMRMEGELSFNDVAAAIGTSTTNARQIASRALKKLKTFWT